MCWKLMVIVLAGKQMMKMLDNESNKEIINYGKALTHSPYLDDNYKGEEILRRENERC